MSGFASPAEGATQLSPSSVQTEVADRITRSNSASLALREGPDSYSLAQAAVRSYKHPGRVANQPRILALGRSLRDPRVHTASFASDRTLLQYEVVIWDAERTIDPYDAGSEFKGAPCLSDSSSVAFNADRSRRQQEITDFLGLGRLLVIFLPTPYHWFVATGETRNEGTAANPNNRRMVSPVPITDLLPIAPKLVKASGDGFRLVAGAPFSTFWKSVKDQFLFGSYMSEPVGSVLLTMSAADRAVGALAEAHGATVLFLPQLGYFEPDEPNLDEDDPEYDDAWNSAIEELDAANHGVFITALLDLERELLGTPDEALPGWTENYLLAGEADAMTAVTKAVDRVTRAQSAAEKARASLESLQRQKTLVAGTGTPLEARVEDALTSLGCTVEHGVPGRTDRLVRWKKHVAVLEVKGLTKSAAEKHCAQLEKWVSEYIEEHDDVPRAILAVSAWRSKAPNDRTEPAFPDQMLPFAKGRNHCLVETGQILNAALTCTSKTKKEAFLKALFETVGPLPGYPADQVLTYRETSETSSQSPD